LIGPITGLNLSGIDWVIVGGEFGRGFSGDSLSNMRKFYLVFKNRNQISETPSRKLKPARKPLIAKSDDEKSETSSRISPEMSSPFCLSWSHYVFLLGIKNADERSFYEIEAASQNWAVRELKRQFDSSLYELLALSRDKKGICKLSREGQIVSQPNDLLKEPLVLEFLGLDEQTRYSESDLETGIINQIEKFLLE
jgi:hypothetical protein